LRALREGIDTATPTGRAVAAIMATLAELELELGRERRAASRQSRRARQLPATKPPKLEARSDKTSYGVSPQLENRSANSPKHSGSYEQRRTATYLGTRVVRTRSGEIATSSSAAATAI
jgi:DNA invertase Pin-like site-specific DNA recombinase